MDRLLKLLLAVVVAGCSTSQPCDLVTQLKARAGGNATDCGYATMKGANTAAVDTCVVQSFQGGLAFFAQYERQGEDVKVVLGIAGDTTGRVTYLLWDSDPSGQGKADPAILGTLCVGPSVDMTPSRDSFVTPPLACTSTPSLGQVCN